MRVGKVSMAAVSRLCSLSPRELGKQLLLRSAKLLVPSGRLVGSKEATYCAGIIELSFEKVNDFKPFSGSSVGAIRQPPANR